MRITAKESTLIASHMEGIKHIIDKNPDFYFAKDSQEEVRKMVEQIMTAVNSISEIADIDLYLYVENVIITDGLLDD